MRSDGAQRGPPGLSDGLPQGQLPHSDTGRHHFNVAAAAAVTVAASGGRRVSHRRE